MQFHQLRSFVAVAETLNISRAAARLNLAQSSVSEQIAALEEGLGASLLDRRRRKLMLTPTGQRFLPCVRRVLESVEDARAVVATCARTVAGPLRLGALETLASRYLPGHLVDFGDRYPEVELSLRTMSTGAAVSGLRSGDLDCAILIGGPPDDDRLRSVALSVHPVVVISAAGVELKCKGDELVLDDERVIATAKGCAFRAIVDRFPMPPEIVMVVDSLATAVSLVEAGRGIAILPEMAIGGASVTITRLNGDHAGVSVTMVWRHRRVMPPALEAFVDLMTRSHQAVSTIDV